MRNVNANAFLTGECERKNKERTRKYDHKESSFNLSLEFDIYVARKICLFLVPPIRKYELKYRNHIFSFFPSDYKIEVIFYSKQLPS